ncbi:MAG: universal stress protein [Pseudohongiellaceae bacterium]
MFSKALIALDLSPSEQPILDCLPGLRAWGLEELVLTHVMPVGYMQGLPQSHETEYRDWLDKLATPLREAGFVVTTVLRSSGRPAEEILTVADEVKASLVIVGSRGHNRVSRMFLGSVAREVVRKSQKPVLLEWIEPGDGQGEHRCDAVCLDTLRHVVLSTDLSGNAAAAADAAVLLAGGAKRVDCLHVNENNGAGATSPGTGAQDRLETLLARIREAGSNGEAVVLDGRPSAVIAGYAKDHDVSLIVVGKRGSNPVESLFTGSTAANLCEIAGRPVLMVP